MDECKCEFSFDMKVTRIFESPRVTKPYTEEQWGEIESLGRQLDTELARHDVRLTMGGEPTFVSIDDMDGAEWNTIALGPTKRRLADDLIKRLKRRFTTGALLHYGQGKWYPGESLPRWSFACYWRKDGQPIWHNEALFADEAKNYGFAERQRGGVHLRAGRAPRLRQRVDHARVRGRLVLPVEGAPAAVNVDPLKSKLKDEEDRARLAKVFEQGLDKIVGYVLPLQRQLAPASTPGWVSGPWFLRRERCYLIPGDSPMGLRLPLDSLPWVSAGDYPYVNQRDPFDEPTSRCRRAQKHLQILLPRMARARGVAGGESGVSPRRPPAIWPPRRLRPTSSASRAAANRRRGSSARRSASSRATGGCTSSCRRRARWRITWIASPPWKTPPQLLDTPVVIEGYPPPFDPRLNVLKVTPDPGVIEVNMHPSALLG